MTATKNFSDSEQERIKTAVAAAETRTSGEIVPVIVPASSDYPASRWKAAVFGALLGLITFESIVSVRAGWGGEEWLLRYGISIMMILGIAFLELIVHFSPAVKRLFVGSSHLEAAVHSRAQRAFLDHEVFSTRERTGILLLISMFERRVEVLGDSGINEKVDEKDWAEVITDVVQGIKNDDTTSGLVRAIERCGDLLESAGVAIRSDDTNELSNEARFED